MEAILELLPSDGSVARADEPLRIALTCYEVLYNVPYHRQIVAAWEATQPG